MTLIIGIIKNDKVYLGADSAGVGGLDVTVRKDPKVFKNGNFLIGCTSSFRMIQLLRFSLNPPKRHPDKDVYEYMCTDFINAVRNCFKDGGYNALNSNVESGGVFIVGYEKRLFKIESDYQVGESFELFSAVGCGDSYALGALMAIDENIDPIERIKKALEIGVHRSGGIRPPFVILEQ